MYAIIRAGGKQAKVKEGDVLDVERIKTEGEVTFKPLLIVNDDGSVISDRDALDKLTVTTEVVGDSTGPKIDIFKYKNKTGYRRRAGHRQKYTRLEVKKIELPAAQKKAEKTPVDSAEKAETTKAETTPADSAEKAEKKSADSAKKTATKKAETKKAETKKADSAEKAEKKSADSAKKTATKKAEKKSADAAAKTETKEG
jgi:large subunit ribosomal protein L21